MYKEPSVPITLSHDDSSNQIVSHLSYQNFQETRYIALHATAAMRHRSSSCPFSHHLVQAAAIYQRHPTDSHPPSK